MKPEAALQKQIMGLGLLYKWKVAHFHDSRREVKPGVWVGDRDAAGVPDLLFARERQFFAELKDEGKEPSTDQVVWLDALARAGVESYLWRQTDFDEIKKVLSKRWRFLPRGIRTSRPGRELERPCLVESDGVKSRLWTPGSLWVGGGRADEVEKVAA